MIWCGGGPFIGMEVIILGGLKVLSGMVLASMWILMASDSKDNGQMVYLLTNKGNKEILMVILWRNCMFYHSLNNDI